MKLYIATPINARQEPTMREKLVAAKHRVEMLKAIIANDIRFKDYELISTFDFNDWNETDEKAMSRCIYHVLTSDAIYLDHGWTASKGCNLEYLTAKIYGKHIFINSEHKPKKTMKLYIATPINARQEPTMREKLVAAKHRVEMLKEILADDVRFKDYELISTFDFNDRNDTEEKAMSRCIYHVLTSDAIYLDHGWTASNGCNLEYQAAKIYGKQIFINTEH